MPLELDFGSLVYGGHRFIGITTLTRSVGTSPGLVKWEVKKAIERYERELAQFQEGKIDGTEFNRRKKIENLQGEAKEVRKRAASQGNQRHTMLEAFATGDADSLAHYKEKMPSQYSALDDWLTENKADILMSEFHVANDEILVHGRSDVYIKTSRGRGVYDLKSNPNIFKEQKLQIAFYAHSGLALNLEGEAVEYAPDYAAILVLADEGIVEKTVGDTVKLFEVVKTYRTLYDQMKGCGL